MNTQRVGMLGALMDEYERSTIDLKIILKNISLTDFTEIKDHKTEDPDCKSIQTVMTHVVQSGYTYANYLNTVFDGDWNEYKHISQTPSESISELDKMLTYNDQVLSDKYQLPLKEIEAWSFDTRWGTTYDAEQLLEHAIVHILRHRRQIKRFLT